MTANPSQFPGVLRGARRALLRRFPYILFFTINDNSLLLIACFHVSRARSREAATERLRKLRRPLPAGFTFDRSAANER
jgi:hypothetical protein